MPVRFPVLGARRSSARSILALASAATMLSLPAVADGGTGAGFDMGGTVLEGGSPGSDNSTTPGGNGSPPSSIDFNRGGGGGGAGVSGGAGGVGGGSPPGGAGGAGGAAPGGDGVDGGNGTSGLGGGGGGGGAHGYVDTGLPGTVVSGGNGGAGGSSSGGGGGGGAGGYGAVVTGTGVTGTISDAITGGQGGAGGASSTFLNYIGAGGGSGGIGLLFTGGGIDVTINAAVSGGTGGVGGIGQTNGTAGAGGVGIEGADDLVLTLGSSAVVSGGLDGNSATRANAITFASGFTNVLTLHYGATITGNVEGNGSTELHFGGAATNGSFDVGTVGLPGAQFQGMTSLEKVDSGTWTFTGINASFTGDTLVSGGTLAVDATFSSSNVTVASGGTLKGIGTVGSVDVLSGGIHAPGNSIGTQMVGNYALQAGGILEIEVDDAGDSDVVVVTGTVSLSGAILRVIAAAGTYGPLTEYLIIDNDGSDAVTGTFASITSSLAFLIPSVVYDGGDGNDVVLTLTVGSDPISFCSVATTANECAVANAAQKLGEGNPIYGAILVQSAAGAQQAYNALSGEVHATVGSTLANDSHYVRDILLGRLVQAYYARTNPGAQVAGLASGGPTTAAGLGGSPMMGLGMGSGAADARDLAVVSPITFWAQGYGAWADFESNGNAAGANRTLGGFMSGMDAMFNDNWRIGSALGYARSDVSVGDGRFSSADVDSYQLAAYTSGNIGAFVVRGGLVWSWSNIDTSRSVVFPGFAENVAASYSGNTGQVFGEVALPLAYSHIAYEPFANLAWVGVDTGGFTETGGDAALSSNGAYDSVGYSSLGVRVAGSMFIHGTEVIPRASAAWLHAFGDVDPDQGLAFATFGQSFVVSGVPLAQDSALIDAGFDVLLAPDATLGFFYTGQFADKVQDNAINGRVNWRF